MQLSINPGRFGKRFQHQCLANSSLPHDIINHTNYTCTQIRQFDIQLYVSDTNKVCVFLARETCITQLKANTSFSFVLLCVSSTENVAIDWTGQQYRDQTYFTNVNRK